MSSPAPMWTVTCKHPRRGCRLPRPAKPRLRLQRAHTEERQQLQAQHQAQLQQLQQRERQLREEQGAARKRVEAEGQVRQERARAQEEARLQQEREDARLRQEVRQGQGGREPAEACMTSNRDVSCEGVQQTDGCTTCRQRPQRHTHTQAGFHTAAACHVMSAMQRTASCGHDCSEVPVREHLRCRHDLCPRVDTASHDMTTTACNLGPDCIRRVSL